MKEKLETAFENLLSARKILGGLDLPVSYVFYRDLDDVIDTTLDLIRLEDKK